MSILKPRIFWPMNLLTGEHAIIANDGATTSSGTIVAGLYLTPEDFADAVQTALQTRLPGCTVTVGATGRITIEWNSAFTMKFGTSPSTQPYTKLGFFAVDAASVMISVSVHRVVSPKQHENGFYLEQAVKSDSNPQRDTSMDVVTRNVAGQTKFVNEAELSNRKITFAYLPPEKVYAAYASGNGYVNQAFETFWINGKAKFRYWEDAATLLAPVDYVLGDTAVKGFAPTRQLTQKALYLMELVFWAYVA